MTFTKLQKAIPKYQTFGSLHVGSAAENVSPHGILIGFKRSLGMEILDSYGKDGWFVLLKCKLRDKTFVLGSIYLPSCSNFESFRNVIDDSESALTRFQCDNVILVGDFNLTFSLLDNSKYITPRHKHVSEYFTIRIMEKWDLQDVWRVQHPHSKKCSHFPPPPSNSSHLDYCFVSLEFSCFIKSCEYGVSYCSDHLPLFTQLHFNNQGPKKNFRFPIDLCASDQFRFLFKSNLEHLKRENMDARPDILWELIKPCARGSALGFKKMSSIYRKEVIESLECKISATQMKMALEPNLLVRASIWESMDHLKKELDGSINPFLKKDTLTTWHVGIMRQVV